MRSGLLASRFSRLGDARRAMAIAVAGLCLVGQLASFAHLVTVQHVTCPEHGEIIHADALANGPQGSGNRPAAAAWLRVVVPTGPRHGHELCVVWAHQRERVEPQRAIAFVRSEAPSEPSMPREGDAPIASPAALLLLAPKSSPPA